MISKLYPNLNERCHSTIHQWIDLINLIFKTAFFTLHIILSILGSHYHVDCIKEQVKGYFTFSHHIINLVASFPAISALCLWLKRNKLSKIEHELNNISESLRIPATSCKRKCSHYLFPVVLILELWYELRNDRCNMIVFPSVYTFYMSIFLQWLELRQFAERFAVLRYYYRKLSERLSIPWEEKEELVQRHDVLGCCCTTLWECYVVQITIFLLYSSLLSVFYIYLVVDSFSRSGTFTTYHYVYLFWTILYCFLIWLILYSCAETKNMVRVLYQLFCFDSNSIYRQCEDLYVY